MPTLPLALAPGALVAGRYRLVRLLGAGGMADVWAATDERLHRRVALKVLRDGGTAEDAEVARRRFQAEGQLAARQIHRSIVTVFDAGEDDGRAYLVMEQLSGHTLADRLALGPLSDREARMLMGDVLAALDAAHRAGVVHRDIKPSNVLAVDGGRWKVADFGIAKEVDPTSTSDRTLVGQVVGTPRFMAPERLAGHPATVASDVFSAGVLLGDALGDRPDVDPRLRAAADRATAQQPGERFASAGEMARAITGAPDAASAVPSFGAGGASQLEPTEVAGPARVAVAPVGTAAMPTRVADAPPTDTLPVAPLDRTGRRRTWIALAAAALLLVGGGLAATALQDDGGGEPVRTKAVTTSTSRVADQTTAPATVPTTSTTASTTTSPTTTPTEPAPPPGPKDGPGGKPGKGKGGGKGGKPKG